MELRFITFNDIIKGNLMPWLAENRDPEKYRLILRKLANIKSGQTDRFFGILPELLGEMGINAGKKLNNEWQMFSKITVHPDTPGIINPFMFLPDDNPKLLFYTSLITQNLSACFSLITSSVAESSSVPLQKHRVMGFMKMLSDLIVSCRALRPAEEENYAIINRMLAGLAVLYTETGKRYPGAIEPSMLRVSNADIKSILIKTVNRDENTETLFTSLVQIYFPVVGEQFKIVSPTFKGDDHKQSPEPPNEAEIKQTDFKTALEEAEKAREEISVIKKALVEAGKKKQTGVEIEDRRIGSAEACKLLKISKSTLKAHREKHLYKSTKIGSQYYYSLNEINEKLKLK